MIFLLIYEKNYHKKAALISFLTVYEHPQSSAIIFGKIADVAVPFSLRYITDNDLNVFGTQQEVNSSLFLLLKILSFYGCEKFR